MASTEIILALLLAITIGIVVTLLILVIRRSRDVVKFPYPGQPYEDETAEREPAGKL